MGRKFCERIYRLIEKKGQAPCVHRECEGYIHKVREDHPNPETWGFVEDFYFYECDKNPGHAWRVEQCSLYSDPIISETILSQPQLQSSSLEDL